MLLCNAEELRMSEIDKEASKLFRQTVGKVRPVYSDKHAEATSAPAARLLNPKTTKELIEDSLANLHEQPEIQIGDVLSYARPGVSHSTLRKLRRGQYRIEANLDLHGLTLNEARLSLLTFIRKHSYQNQRCVRVIHGKGWRSSNQGPVLKPNVNYWLRQLDEVLAFHSARPVDGGTGAIYVLLRSSPV